MVFSPIKTAVLLCPSNVKLKLTVPEPLQSAASLFLPSFSVTMKILAAVSTSKPLGRDSLEVKSVLLMKVYYTYFVLE